MKTFEERKQRVQSKIQTIRRRRRRVITTVASSAVALALLLTVLFIPYDTSMPDVSRYADSEYYGLIQKLNAATYQKPEHKNRFQALGDFLSGMAPAGMDKAENALPPMMNEPQVPGDTPEGGNDVYHETTDNQVAGVIESDIIKRSDKYIFYLRNQTLCVYLIAGYESYLVGEYTLDAYQLLDQWENAEAGDAKANEPEIRYAGEHEMYLSQDCRTITLITRIYRGGKGNLTMVLNLDVSDPANIQPKDHAIFEGHYISSRLTDGSLLLVYQYAVTKSELDFDDPETFVPGYAVNGKGELVGGDNIVCPENPNSVRYTVLCTVDQADLQVTGSVALLDYTAEMYVSQDTVYLTRPYAHKTDLPEKGKGWYRSASMTEITAVSYTAEGLQILGTIQLEGSVKDQYSMDQYEGILRVVTSTTVNIRKEYTGRYTAEVVMGETKRNVNLYCIDLSAWQIRSCVIGFAPEGEDAQSVRFDGVNAYVCTAEVITMTDPVYFFDLSDPDNITYTDTGTIDGYSTSLIQLGNGYLLGIGFGADRDTVKLEVYAEQDGKVVSVCDYSFRGYISLDYKAYFIDREQDLIGLGMVSYDNGHKQQAYILLHFDGQQINQVLSTPMAGGVDQCRATLVEDFFYVLGSGDMDFFVEKVK